MKFCMQCGTNLNNNVQQCSECDTKIDKFYARSLSGVKGKRNNILKARESYLQGDYSNSVRLLSEIAIREPKNINILFGLGRSLSSTKDYSRAMQVYERALKIKPDSVNILFAEGLCYKEIGDLKEAKKYFIRCLELEPVFKNARQMMKTCEDELQKEHDDIVRTQMKDIFKARPKREKAVREEIGKADYMRSGPDEERGESYRCIACGNIVLFEDQYQMWWCDRCSRYVEEDMLRPDAGESPYEEEEEYTCEKCDTSLTFVEEYQRWWCDGCRKYIEEGREEPIELEPVSKERSGFSPDVIYCEKCDKAMRFVDVYQMWWCEKCEKYLGEDEEVIEVSPKRDKSSRRSPPMKEKREYERSPDMAGEYAQRPPEHFDPQVAHGHQARPDHPIYPCRKCGTVLKFIDQYQRWWCDGCYEYV